MGNQEDKATQAQSELGSGPGRLNATPEVGRHAEVTPKRKHRIQGAALATAAIVLGIILTGVWLSLCLVAEGLANAADPSGGASFFAMIPILLGVPVFFVAFPIFYWVSRSFLGFGAPLFRKHRAIAWGLWSVPLVVFVVLVTVSGLTYGEFASTAGVAAALFPLLGWRIYASRLDSAREP